MRPLIAAILIAFPAACPAQERTYDRQGTERIYVLEEIDGTEFKAPATIVYPADGHAEGDGPCNRWSATQSAPYPWFTLGPIAASRRACKDLPAEKTFFDALRDMEIANLKNDVLTLKNGQGRRMVFRVAQD